MLKIVMESGNSLLGKDVDWIGIKVYNSLPSKDGLHISASSFCCLPMLKKLSKKNIDLLISNLVPCIEACNREVDRRINLENDKKEN